MAHVTVKPDPRKIVTGIDNLIVGNYYWSIESNEYVLCAKSDGKKMVVFLYSGLSTRNPTDNYIEFNGELNIQTD